MINFSKRSLFSILFVGVLLLAGCRGAGGETPTSTPQPTATTSATETQTAIPESTAEVVARAEIPATPTPTVTRRPTPTATLEPAALIPGRLFAVLDSDDWPVVGLDPALAESWEAFARHKGDLSGDELAVLQQFLDHWELLQQSAEKAISPREAELALRVENRPGASGN